MSGDEFLIEIVGSVFMAASLLYMVVGDRMLRLVATIGLLVVILAVLVIHALGLPAVVR